jgi:hypothetical protein
MVHPSTRRDVRSESSVTTPRAGTCNAARQDREAAETLCDAGNAGQSHSRSRWSSAVLVPAGAAAFSDAASPEGGPAPLHMVTHFHRAVAISRSAEPTSDRPVAVIQRYSARYRHWPFRSSFQAPQLSGRQWAVFSWSPSRASAHRGRSVIASQRQTGGRTTTRAAKTHVRAACTGVGTADDTDTNRPAQREG